jgi:hypothetical protein
MAVKPQPPSDDAVHSIATRKVVVMALVVPVVVAFTALLLQYKGFIDVSEFGLAENYLYIGAFGVIFLALIPMLVVWRCPGCRAYLGRDINPARCPSCGARFR